MQFQLRVTDVGALLHKRHMYIHHENLLKTWAELEGLVWLWPAPPQPSWGGVVLINSRYGARAPTVAFCRGASRSD